MRLKEERQTAWTKLFGNPMSINVVITCIEEQGFRKPLEGETVLQNWKKVFGEKGKYESIALLKRVQQAKDYDFVKFRETFANKFMQQTHHSEKTERFKIRYDDFMSQD